jgi:hypothetical protein
MKQDHTAQRILKRFSELKHGPQEAAAAAEALTPYEEFVVDDKTYYFTPGGFLYRREPGTEEVGGFFCGYLSGEAWRYRTDIG